MLPQMMKINNICQKTYVEKTKIKSCTIFSDEADDYLICFDTDEDRFLSCSPMILSESVDLAYYGNCRFLMQRIFVKYSDLISA